MKPLKILFLLVLLSISISAQKSQQEIEEEQRRIDKERQRQLEAQDRKKMGQLSPDIFSPKKADDDVSFAETAIYPTSEQKKRLRPDEEDFAKYSVFLKQSQTGLIKIFPNFECIKDKFVIRADGHCANEIPFSSFYSFRQRKYSPQDLADLELKDDRFLTNGKLANGIIVSLGNIPLESVTLKSTGMPLLAEFPAAQKKEEVLAKSVRLENGLRVGDYLYSSAVAANQNTTYAIRVIAYQNNNLPKFPRDPRFYTAGEDKRIDVLVVFRVVRKANDGSLTLLWKELQRKNSPKIKTPNLDRKNDVSKK